MAASSTVRVTYRSLKLAPAAAVSERGGGLRFVAIDTPPPVRTVLALAEDGGKPIVVEVVEAIEVEAPGVVRGCVVREVDRARLQQAVGSERLANGAAGGEPPPAQDDREPSASSSGTYDEGYGSAMAVPAPVVGDAEPSDAIDLDNPDEADEGDDGEPSSEGNGNGPARAKKRRGRKRK